MIAETLNVLNEKGLRYKAVQEEKGLGMAFGVIAQGKKEKITVYPQPEAIVITAFGSEKSVDEAGFQGYVDNILKLKALQEEELKLIETLKA